MAAKAGSSIKSARAYANNQVAFIAWVPDGRIENCLGFEVTRLYDDGTSVVAAAWVPFEGQDNPQWKPQTTSVWPVQKFWWRDLTLRQSRNDATLHPKDFGVRYRIRPLGRMAPGLQPAPQPDSRPYTGEPVPLGYLDGGVETNPIRITSDFGPVKASFNKGVLSTQWLSHALATTMGQTPSLGRLKQEMLNLKSPIRRYLAGDLPGMMQAMFGRLDAGGELYLALYELDDEFLIGLIRKYADKVHLILSNTGQNPTTKEWDGENAPVREEFSQPGAIKEMHSRMFNNNQHIGHNKFAVYVDKQGQAQAVLSGSTNWTPNGLCAQSNNAFVIDSPEVAQQYLGYWNDILKDNDGLATPEPMSAATSNAQGKALRDADAAPLDPVQLGDKWGLRLWRSPNTPQKTKPQNPPRPPDMAEILSLMQQAEKAIFFAVFLPGMRGETSIIEDAIDIATQRPDLMVYGAISSPMAMPNYVTKLKNGDAGDDDPKKPQPSIYEKGRIHIVRANSLNQHDIVSDFEAELLSAGNAIIHDKILVIDPLSDNAVIVAGSHNLGFKASYANDDNLIIVRGNPLLAQAYAVHIIDLYDHYRFRGVAAERSAAKKPAWSGFLKSDASWQDKYKKGIGDLAAYFGGA